MTTEKFNPGRVGNFKGNTGTPVRTVNAAGQGEGVGVTCGEIWRVVRIKNGHRPFVDARNKLRKKRHLSENLDGVVRLHYT